MLEIEIIRGRYYTYLVFSDLFLRGITADIIPQVSAIPELAGFIKDPMDFDEAAAEHHSLFSLDIIPYESIFRDPSRLLGGGISNQVQQHYRRCGFDINTDGDHIGHELRFLAYLCALEIENFDQRGFVTEYSQRGEQRQFFQEHLLCWLPAFFASLELSGSRFYKELGLLTLSIINDHFVNISSSPQPLCELEVAEITNLSQTQDTSLHQIVDFLITPPISGIYLGREQIRILSRRHQLPLGFGNRHQMLLNLFRASGQFESSRSLFQDLILIVDNFISVYQQQMNEYPELSAWIRPWESKSEKTREYLTSLMEQISS